MPNVVLTGPIFDGNMAAKLKEGVLDGLKEIGTEVVADVHEQLYPGHGWVTGRLKGSIGVKWLPGPGFVVESGAVSGDAVPYAYWIETGMRRGRQLRQGYGMFRDARWRLQSNARHVEPVIGKAIVKKLGGRGL